MVDFRDWKIDTRSRRHGWAPGDYTHKCSCGDQFIGSKRAIICADCAYALPDTQPPVPEIAARDAQVEWPPRLAEVMELKQARAALEWIVKLTDGDRAAVTPDTAWEAWKVMNLLLIEVRETAKKAVRKSP